MKKLFQLLACGLLAILAWSCDQGAAAIDKAYDQALKSASAEEVATTLCNGDIKCETLTSDEAAKLGACIGYITYTGLYSSNFEAQVDMYQWGKLMDGYRALEKNQTGQERNKIEELTKAILTAGTVPVEK